MTAQELGAVLIEEMRDFYEDRNDSEFAAGCYDLSKVSAVKGHIDDMVSSMWSNYSSVMGDGDSSNDGDNDKYHYFSIMPYTPIHYFDETSETHLRAKTYYDLTSLSSEIANDPSMSVLTRHHAGLLADAAGEMIIYSYATSDITGFTEGENGISLFASSFYTTDLTLEGGYGETPYIAFHWWYNSQQLTSSPSPLYPSLYGSEGYGNLSWCIDGATEGNGSVENWFEFIDDVCDQGYAPVTVEGWNGYMP
jgi:clostripain